MGAGRRQRPDALGTVIGRLGSELTSLPADVRDVVVASLEDVAPPGSPIGDLIADIPPAPTDEEPSPA
jgi:hypothetical protein